MSMKDWEKSPQDRKHDRGERVEVRKHDRAPRGTLPPKRPVPGPNEFTPAQEQAMRAGSERRTAPAGPPPMPPEDDIGMM